MAKTPTVSSREVLRALVKLGSAVARQKGSHARLEAVGRASVTVPMHNPVSPGTSRSILRTVEKFVGLLG